MDRFIVGTGRCGSTLLSRMLAFEPGTLSIFEFFNGLDVARRFAPQPIDGSAFASLIASEQPFVTAVLRRGYDVAEITYPFERGGRYSRNDALPWILVSTLPRLDDDPDRLFERTMAFARGLPAQPVVAHYRALFGWWCKELSKQHWIERCGSSIDYLESLIENFPDARFLHIHRDGREAALSMREHHAYRLPIAILYRAADGSGPALGEIDFDAPPDPSDPISRILDSRPPVEYYGRYWSDQVIHGFRALRRLDADRYAEVAFEDLVRQPRAALERIVGFFALDPTAERWIDRAVGLVRGVPSSRDPNLPEAERSILARECRPGMQLLGRAR